ncbi:MAG: hypothetical protein FJ009_11630 [Chloroflexi bacterium]|nr:hypothetical protein [Chloroflexota bacterium]
MRRIILAVLLGALAVCLTACPPKPPCDEPIGSKQIYRDAILSHPVTLQLNDNLQFHDIIIAECFVKGELSIGLLYHLPADMSSFGVVYADWLGLAYAKDGRIQIVLQYTGERQPFTYENVIGLFKERISSAENNPSPKVREFIAKVSPMQGNLSSCCWLGTMPPSPWAEIRYNANTKLVYEYLLPNSIQWSEFPEIERMHQIIEENLLVGNLSNCKIGKDDRHAYTRMQMTTAGDVWMNFSVALLCDDGWKDASVRLYPNGTYDQLVIQYEYKNK